MRFEYKRLGKLKTPYIPFRLQIRYCYVPGRIRSLEIHLNTHRWCWYKGYKERLNND